MPLSSSSPSPHFSATTRNDKYQERGIGYQERGIGNRRCNETKGWYGTIGNCKRAKGDIKAARSASFAAEKAKGGALRKLGRELKNESTGGAAAEIRAMKADRRKELAAELQTKAEELGAKLEAKTTKGRTKGAKTAKPATKAAKTKRAKAKSKVASAPTALALATEAKAPVANAPKRVKKQLEALRQTVSPEPEVIAARVKAKAKDDLKAPTPTRELSPVELKKLRNSNGFVEGFDKALPKSGINSLRFMTKKEVETESANRDNETGKAEETNRDRSMDGYLAPRRKNAAFLESGDLNKVALVEINATRQGSAFTADDIATASKYALSSIPGSQSKVLSITINGSSNFRGFNEIRRLAKESGGRFRAVYDPGIERTRGISRNGSSFNPLEKKTTGSEKAPGRMILVANIDDDGNMKAPTLAEIKAGKTRQIAERLRDYQFNAGVRKVHSEFIGSQLIVYDREKKGENRMTKILRDRLKSEIATPDISGISESPQLKGKFLTEAYKEEEFWAKASEKFESKHITRGKTAKDMNSAELTKVRRAATEWAESQFGPVKGVNGFTQKQTAQHDIAHPITHTATGMNTKQIQKLFGTKSLVAEEAIVTAMEHLSRGDTLEASLAAGRRLARVLSRGEEGREYYGSDDFSGKLRATVAKAHEHPDHGLHAAMIRKANRQSTTTFQGGEDYFNTREAANLAPGVATQNKIYREIGGNETLKTIDRLKQRISARKAKT